VDREQEKLYHRPGKKPLTAILRGDKRDKNIRIWLGSIPVGTIFGWSESQTMLPDRPAQTYSHLKLIYVSVFCRSVGI
jgi:hypothetical protein